MEPFFHCELEYSNSPHLSQIYEGFYRLLQKKLITISILKSISNPRKPIIKAKLTTGANQTFIIYYDTLDGLNWLDNKSVEENLLYFRNNLNADYYFKRSFNKDVVKYAPKNCKVFSLGLNYHIESNHNFYSFRHIKLKKYLKRIIPKKYHDGVLYAEDFEHPPFYNDNSKVLFLTKLWDPKKVDDPRLKSQREELNNYRIECIEACRKELGSSFTGGLLIDDYSKLYAKHHLAPIDITNKTKFVEQIKSHNICIATTGLHSSIGWKFAEYIAGSRAVVSEPLQYEIPGTFCNGSNYYEFSNKNELLEKIFKLLNNQSHIKHMMYNNFVYYNLFLKPDNLVLNSFLSICANFPDVQNKIKNHAKPVNLCSES